MSTRYRSSPSISIVSLCPPLVLSPTRVPFCHGVFITEPVYIYHSESSVNFIVLFILGNIVRFWPVCYPRLFLHSVRSSAAVFRTTIGTDRVVYAVFDLNNQHSSKTFFRGCETFVATDLSFTSSNIDPLFTRYLQRVSKK